SDVVLEDDDHEHQGPVEDVVEEDVDGVDLELSRQHVDGVDHAEPDQHRNGPRAADQVDGPVDDEREQQDVERVLPAKPEQQFPHAPTSASVTATTSAIACTSCTRSRDAPRATAHATAAAVPKTRSAGALPAPRKLFRDTPTNTG